MYAQGKNQKFRGSTPEFHRPNHRRTWLSLLNIIIVGVIVILLILVFLAIL